MSLDKLQMFADALHIEPWQLLFPGFKRGSPQFPVMSVEAIDTARHIDAIKDDATRKRAYAAVVNMLEMLASEPAEPTQSVPVPTHKPETHR